MSSYKVYSGMPFKFKARANYYWDKIYSGTIFDNTTMNVELEPYEGLTITAEPNNSSYLINVSEGELPDYTYFDGVKGVLGHKTFNYLLKVDEMTLFETIGTPSIDTENKTVTGFNESNYLQHTVSLPNVFTFYTKFTINSNASNQIAMSNQTTGASPVRSDGLVLKAWSSSQNFGAFSLTNNSTYWVKGVCDGTTYSLYGMLDTGQTFEEVKVSDAWTLSGSGTQSKFFNVGDNQIILGRNTSSYTSQYLNGVIYLESTEFDGDEVIWKAYGPGYDILPGLFENPNMTDTGEAKTYNAVYKDDKLTLMNQDDSLSQYTWVGSVNVPAHTPDQKWVARFSVNGDVTFDETEVSFGSTAYLEADKTVPDEEYFKFITRVTPSYNSGSRCFTTMDGLAFGTKNSNWFIYIDGAYTGGSFTVGTTYWVQVVQEKTVTKLYYMVDDGTYGNWSSLPDVTNTAWTLGVTVSKKSFIVGSWFRIGQAVANQQFAEVDLDQTILMIPDAWFYPLEGDPTPGLYKTYWIALS